MLDNGVLVARLNEYSKPAANIEGLSNNIYAIAKNVVIPAIISVLGLTFKKSKLITRYEIRPSPYLAPFLEINIFYI